MDIEEQIRVRFQLVVSSLDERARRLFLGAEAASLGRGGVAAVARATGASESTVRRGRRDVLGSTAGSELKEGAVRRPGAGRKTATVKQPGLLEALDALIEPTTRGDPECPLRWTTKSLRRLSAELGAQGFKVGRQVVGELLHKAGYSLQAPSKTREGKENPDRDAQFRFIHDEVRSAVAAGEPVISVDTKKKELVGDFKNGGREWQPKGQPVPVRVHDFVDPTLGKAIPYGVYDVAKNEGWVNVGIDHDTAQFAVESIRKWFYKLGATPYRKATKLVITADCGGSNNVRSRAWKAELQELAYELGIVIQVRHLPPGTSKWNKIEHRLFSHIAINWRGRPLISTETIVALIGKTSTSKGLRVEAELDSRKYPTGTRVPDAVMERVNIVRHEFRGDWNYDILPWFKEPNQ